MAHELDRALPMERELTTASRPSPILSVWGATMITVGVVLGSGIFQTPSLVAGIAGSGSRMLWAWLLGGALSLIGALTYAELASTYPSTGRDYTFLTRAYGRNVGFLFAWARSLVICTGSIALIGFIVGDYLTRLWSLGPYSSAIYAAGAVLLLTALNLLGLRESVRVQTWATALEIAGVLLVAVAAVSLGGPGDTPPAAPAADSGTGFGLAMVFVLLTYGGWNEAAYVSAEVRGGTRAIVKTLLLAIAIITAVYVAFVSAVWYGLGFDALRGSSAVGVDVMAAAFGPAGAHWIGIIVAVCALTSMNSTMIVGARTNYAVAQDWPVFSFMGAWRADRNLPLAGFLVQTGITLALIGFGALERDGFAVMVEFTAPVFWSFFLLSGASVFVLRRKEPGRLRPFRVPLYPALPAVFVATCAYLSYSSVAYAQSNRATYVAIVVVAVGAGVLAVVRARERRNGHASSLGS